MEILATVNADVLAGRLDGEMLSCMSQPLRMAFRQQGMALQPLPFA